MTSDPRAHIPHDGRWRTVSEDPDVRIGAQP